MTLEELKQVKADVDNGIMVSKGTWLRVLTHAINLQDSEDEYQQWVKDTLPQTEEA